MASPYVEPRTYGNFVKPTSPGLGKLGLLPTMMLFVAGVVGMVVQMFAGFWMGLAMAGLILLLLTPLLFQNQDGRNRWQAWGVRLAFKNAELRGRTTYAPHLMGHLAFGAPARLPGLAAKSKLLECEYNGRPFAVISYGSDLQHYAVPILIDPEGMQLVDPIQVDIWVANWGKFHHDAADDIDLVGLSVTIESAPDPGTGVRNAARRMIGPNAPSLSRAVLTEAGEKFPAGSDESTGWVTITWTGVRDGDKLKEADVLEEIAHKLPGLIADLRASGAGRAVPMTAAQLVERVRVALNPDEAEAFAAAKAEGVDPKIPWAEVGEAAQDHWDCYEHADVTSYTYRMLKPPGAPVQSHVLAPMLKADKKVLRKRVTVMYRPHVNHEAPAIAHRDVKTAKGRAGARATEHASEAAAVAHTKANATDVSSGAGLERFSTLMTVTVQRGTTKSAVSSTVKQIAGKAQLLMRPCTGGQAVGFQCAMGIGLVPSAYSHMPQKIRELS